MNPVQMVLTIIVINIIYVSIATVRMIIMLKGQRISAGLLSMIEVFTYVIGLNIVLANIHNPVNLIAYCVGWGSGVYLGSKIESWLALGYVTVQIIVDQDRSHLPEMLREKGFGVTSWTAQGREGHRLAMLVLAKRSNERRLLRTIDELAPKSFVISHDPRFFQGGFWTKRLRPF